MKELVMTLDMIINYFWICNFYLKISINNYLQDINIQVSKKIFFRRCESQNLWESICGKQLTTLSLLKAYNSLINMWFQKCQFYFKKCINFFSGTNGTTQFVTQGCPGSSVVKNLAANAKASGDLGLIPGCGRSPGEGNSNPL